MVSALSIRALTRRMHAGFSGRFLPFQALTEVSLDVHPGEFVALIGPPGAGKSTLLRCAAGELRPTTGRIAWFGIDARSGIVPQGVVLTREYSPGRSMNTITDALRAHSLVYSLPAEVVETRLAASLECTGLQALRDARCGRLSLSTRRRLAFAFALMLRPRLLLADAVLDEIDARARDDLVELLRTLAHEGTAVLLATREARVAERARRQIALVDGRVSEPDVPAGPASTLILDLSLVRDARGSRCDARASADARHTDWQRHIRTGPMAAPPA